MKNRLLILVLLFLGSQLINSCKSGNELANKFSKRKYLKGFKAKKTDTKEIKPPEIIYASFDVEPTTFKLKKVEQIDNSRVVQLKEEVLVQVEKTDSLKKNNLKIKKHLIPLEIPIKEALDNKNIEKQAQGSFSFGVVGLLLPFILLPSLLAIILGVKSLRRINKTPLKRNVKGKGKAILGLLFGILGVIIFHVFVVISFYSQIN